MPWSWHQNCYGMNPAESTLPLAGTCAAETASAEETDLPTSARRGGNFFRPLVSNDCQKHQNEIQEPQAHMTRNQRKSSNGSRSRS